MKCKACQKGLKVVEAKVCQKCTANYHYSCLGITLDNFNKESRQSKSSWRCPECKAVMKRGDNTNTPITPREAPVSPVSTSGSTNSEGLDELKEYFDIKLKEATEKTTTDVKNKITKETKILSDAMEELKASVNFVCSQYDDLNKRFNDKITLIQELQKENASLRAEVRDINIRLVDVEQRPHGVSLETQSTTERDIEKEELREEIKEMNTKLADIEQRSRACNVEVQCVPEKKDENLLGYIKNLCTAVGSQLSDSEIVNFHRVPKLNGESSRPRSIVLKLASPKIRDALLAAVKMFNKSNASDKLNSHHLGVGGDKQPVYVGEHLSPANKKLHAAARIVAKEKKYEFVWVRDGRIYMRRAAKAKAILVRDEEFLKTLPSS